MRRCTIYAYFLEINIGYVAFYENIHVLPDTDTLSVRYLYDFYWTTGCEAGLPLLFKAIQPIALDEAKVITRAS